MKIGDIVRIREDLKEGRMYGVCTFAVPMKEYLGKEGTIIEMVSKYFYLHIEGENVSYKFTEEMIERNEAIETESEVIDEEEITEEVVTDIVDESTEEVVDETEEIIEEEPIIETKKTNKKK